MGIAVEAEVAGAIADFHWNEGEYKRLLQGPVVQDLVKRAIRVESSAKQHATNRPGPRVRTGLLRRSITWRLGQDWESPYVDIGTAVVYAPYLEEGTNFMPPYPFLVPALEAARVP
jgi:hypothetical protein